MSTRSRIGLATPEGAVYSIYCHFDGYPSGVGRTLLNHYQDEAKVRELIDLGDISILDQNIGVKIPFDDREVRELGQQVLAYGRDRDEPGTEAAVDDTKEAFFARVQDGWEEYVYLYEGGQWFVSEVGGGSGLFLVSRRDPDGVLPPNWKPLAEVLNKEAA